jgi:formylglycine-generating enzyme required for sulfatase activity
LLASVPERLRSTARHGDLKADGEQAEEQWNKADDVPAFALADTSFAGVRQRLNDWLDTEESEAEKVARVKVQAEEVARLREQLSAAQTRASALATEIATLRDLRPGSQAGDRWSTTIKGNHVPWRWCPAETYQIGENKNAVTVTLTYGFWMMETECWQHLYISLMGNGKASEWTDSYGRGDRYPAYNVNYEEATSFGKKVTELLALSGWIATLPTEAQWEYAVRAGSEYAYCFGDDPAKLGEYAWFSDNSDGSTHPVGTRKPNNWGIHDGHGSLLEWTSDAWSDKLKGGIDPVVVAGPYRAYRGGSWRGSARYCRSADRYRFLPGYRFVDLGFRLALVPSR